jgi:hypothetical protein
MSQDAAAWIPLFPEEKIPFILAAVLRSGKLLRKINNNELENSLSERLCEIIVSDPDFRNRPVEIQRETPVYDPVRKLGRPLGRPDLHFIFSTGSAKPWPYFAIEAKRLHVAFASGRQSLIAEYVTGNQGMMCFVEERYAKGLDSGGMLGYVFDGEIEKARASVFDCIKKNKKKLKCYQTPHFKPSNICLENYQISESVHRLSYCNMTIYHLFISV